MPHYQPQPQEALFLMQQAGAHAGALAQLPVYAEVDEAILKQVLEEAARFVAEVVAPLQEVGDRVGAQFKNGQVTMPPGFRQAYQAFWQTGWPALSAAVEDGGQGLPSVLEAVLYEWLSAANHGWTMAPGLLHGAYECIKHHASDDIKTEYLGKVATGQWLATMCLTEPQAGSDLGRVTTRAVPQADGRYALSGTKIFISGGEHDLTDNIVHLVLARLPDAPPGPKGLSLFVVPKFYADGSRSAVHCERIEDKMGLHGSPTCVLRFDAAQAAIVGEPGKGLNAMFVMMNAARLHVALQGIGLLDAAWQKAHAYSLERRQMRAPATTRTDGQAYGQAHGQAHGQGDLIAEHPAMRRILDTQRAWVDAGRLLAYRTALELDLARHHPDAPRRDSAQRWCSLVTPVLKSAWTEQGFAGASACLQVFGGHGYVREWGIEQIVRDARVAMIYEGTNEIQAIDLLVRKVLADEGQALGALLDELELTMPAAGRGRIAQLRQASAELLAGRAHDAALPHAVADDYLRALALVLTEWAWAQIGAAPTADAPRWQEPAQALRRHVLPEFGMRLQMIRDRCQDAVNARSQATPT
jgi:alkylation response protein AidB-like acyl-CoA dehydrogenase